LNVDKTRHDVEVMEFGSEMCNEPRPYLFYTLDASYAGYLAKRVKTLKKLKTTTSLGWR